MKELLLFTAPWCEPCKAFKPVFFETAPRYPRVDFRVVDVTVKPDLAKKYRVMSIPTLVALIDGEYVDRKVDPTTEANIIDFIEEVF